MGRTAEEFVERIEAVVAQTEALGSSWSGRGRNPERLRTGYAFSYPLLIEWFASTRFGRPSEVQVGLNAVYGWMPTILAAKNCEVLLSQLGEFVRDARRVVGGGTAPLSDNQVRRLRVGPSSTTGSSLVALTHGRMTGLSKFLHFAVPEAYPIWDSNVRLALGFQKPKSGAVAEGSVADYDAYVAAVHRALRDGCAIPAWAADGYAKRERLSPVRRIELALFLAGGAASDG